MHGQENKLSSRSSFAKFVGGLDSGENWHGDVQYNYVWLQSFRYGDQVPSVGGGPHDFEARFQKSQHARESDAVIVGDQYSRPMHGSHPFSRSTLAWKVVMPVQTVATVQSQRQTYDVRQCFGLRYWKYC
jgi:hypothetical protein